MKNIKSVFFVLLMTMCLIAALPLRADAQEGHTVLFDAGEIGQDTQPAPQTGIPTGGSLVIPTPPRADGYVFEGWYVDPELRILFNFESLITEDMTLYAKWEKASMTGDDNGQTEEVPVATDEVEIVTDDDAGQEIIPQNQDKPIDDTQSGSEPLPPRGDSNTGAKTPDLSDAWVYCLFVAFFGMVICAIFMVIPERHKKGGSK